MKNLTYEKALQIGKENRKPRGFLNCIVEYENAKYLYVKRTIVKPGQSHRAIINKKTLKQEVDDDERTLDRIGRLGPPV